MNRAIALIQALGQHADRVLATLPQAITDQIQTHMTDATPDITPEFYDDITTEVSKITSQESAAIVAEDNRVTALVDKIKSESPRMIAFVVTNLEKKRSEAVMTRLSAAQRTAVAAHTFRTTYADDDPIQAAVIEAVSAYLHD